jgi:mono/diheme cytochrome c family protein
MALKWLLAVIGAAAAALVAVWVLNMVAPEPSVPAGGGPIAAVTLPATLSPAAQIGRNAFAAKCAACHGENADGRQGKAPPLIHIYYEPGHHGDGAFLRAVRQGVTQHHWSFGNMAPVDGLTDADVAGIVTWVREVQRANGID